MQVTQLTGFQARPPIITQANYHRKPAFQLTYDEVHHDDPVPDSFRLNIKA